MLLLVTSYLIGLIFWLIYIICLKIITYHNVFMANECLFFQVIIVLPYFIPVFSSRGKVEDFNQMFKAIITCFDIVPLSMSLNFVSRYSLMDCFLL